MYKNWPKILTVNPTLMVDPVPTIQNGGTLLWEHIIQPVVHQPLVKFDRL